MNLIELLGKNLKSDLINQLFEEYDVEVIYRYDLHNENLPDEYTAEISELGLEFLFDDQQTLSTLFVTLSNIEASVLDAYANNLPIFTSKNEAIQYANDSQIAFSIGKVDFLGDERDWIRLSYPEHSIHYEFVGTKLRLITLQATNR